MTEKRFTMINHNEYDNGDCIYYDNGEEMGTLDVLDTLNELNNGKQQWKRVCHMVEDTYHELQKKFHNWDIALSKCREENKQLKSDNRLLYSRNTDLKRKNELYDAENEQLKQRCKELRNDLINHSALIDMLETVKALDIEDMIWNTMGYKTQTEFDDDFVYYREKAKRRWRE